MQLITSVMAAPNIAQILRTCFYPQAPCVAMLLLIASHPLALCKGANVEGIMLVDLTTEQQWIETVKQLTDERLIIGDDCAILPDRWLITTDMLVEGNHFVLGKIGLVDIGWKAAAVNLSDIAAMAAVPSFAVVSLGLPSGFSHDEFKLLYSGIVECARAFRTRIVGGDLTRSDKLVISVAVIGRSEETKPMIRTAAQPGDCLIATGDFGASAAGLWLILSGTDGYEYCRSRHLRPHPRVDDGLLLGKLTGGEGALMDASDGLADAVMQIARGSKVAIEIDEECIPVHADTRAAAELGGQSPYDLALYGGEDYELVAAVRPEHWRLIEQATGNFQLIGRVVEGQGANLLRGGNRVAKLEAEKTFQHWLSN